MRSIQPTSDHEIDDFGRKDIDGRRRQVLMESHPKSGIRVPPALITDTISSGLAGLVG